MAFPEGAPDRRRARILVLLVLGLLLGLAARLFYLQILRGPAYAELSQRNLFRPDPIRAPRGRILDRWGRALADNLVSYSLSLEVGHPTYSDPAELRRAVEEVASALDLDVEQLHGRALRSREYFAPISVGEDLAPEAMAALIERQYPIAGLRVDRTLRRSYPYGQLAAHVLGYLAEVTEDELQAPVSGRPYRPGSRVGRAGIERQYESELRGVDGETYVTVDALGRKTDLFPGLPPVSPVAGLDLTLALDASVQAAAELALREVQPEGENAGAICAAVVALDPWTGEVVACASSPGYDPNDFARGMSAQAWAPLRGPDRPLLNRAVQAAYPPGSTFKIVTTLAGFHAGVLTEGTTFESCPGYYRFGIRTFRCWKEGGHGVLALRDAFARSCDVYYYQLGRRLGLARLTGYAATLALDTRTGIDLPEERAGLVPTVDWYEQRLGGAPPEGNVLNLAIGQGEIVLTPIEMASFVGALASDGWVRRPHLLLRVQRADGTVVLDRAEPERVRSLPISPAERGRVLSLLEAVVADPQGTGRRAQVEGFRVGGKTGTAQNPHGPDHALFVAVAPIEAPRIAVVVVLEAAGHGGVAAAPVAQRVLAAFLKGPEEGSADSLMSAAGHPAGPEL